MKLKSLACVAGLSFVLFACDLVGSQKAAFVSRKADQTITFTPQSAKPVDVFLVLDQSGSMEGYGRVQATDPTGLRVRASQRFIRNVAWKSDPNDPNRVGIVNFGTGAPPEYIVPLTPVFDPRKDPKNVGELEAKLRPLSLGETNFLAALRAAQNGFVTGQTIAKGRKPVIVIFTDGEPDDPRRFSKDKYFQEIEDFAAKNLRSQGVEIFLVWIDAVGRSWDRYAPKWQKILPPKSVLRITEMGELRDKFNEIVQIIFGIPRVPPEVVTPAGLDFEVPPYLEKLEFHIFPEQENLKLNIFRPDGKAVKKGEFGVWVRPELEDEIVIFDPAPGKWRYQITEGRGKVKVYRNPIMIKMKLVRPEGGVHPVGKGLVILANFSRADGKEVVPHSKYPLKLTAQIIGPDVEQKELPLSPRGKCLYVSPSLPITREGPFNIVLKVRAGDVHEGMMLSSTGEYTVTARLIPYVVIENPSDQAVLPLCDSLPVRVGLMQNGVPFKAEGTFSNASFLAQIVETPPAKVRQEFDRVWLDPQSETAKGRKEKEGVHQGVLPVKLRTSGQYRLGVKIFGELLSKENIPGDYSEVAFTVTPNRWQVLWIGLSKGAFGVGLLVGILVLVSLGWSLSLPRMRGNLSVFPSEEEAGGPPIARKRLDGKKILLFLGKKKIPPDKITRGLFIVYRKRRPQDAVVLRLWRGLLPRGRRLLLGSGARVGKFFAFYQ